MWFFFCTCSTPQKKKWDHSDFTGALAFPLALDLLLALAFPLAIATFGGGAVEAVEGAEDTFIVLRLEGKGWE